MMSKLRNSLCELCTALIFFCGCSNEPLQPIRSGEIWPDNNGEHINAHGGGVMYYDGTYYWFGENKCDTTSSAMVGVMCYSSRNLTDWKNEGVALSVVDNDSSDIARGCILERPKVIYNAKTGKFVMWFHLELKGKGYAAARSAVAISDSPTGPFKYIRSERINPGVLPFDMNETQRAMLDTLDAEKYKEWWAAYDVPRHLWHFTPSVMQQFGVKHGFKLAEQHPMPFDAFYVSMLTERYKGSRLSFLKGMWTGLLAWFSSLAKKERSSSMIYVFRKK